MSNKKSILIIIVVAILAAGGIGFWYWPQKKSQESAATGTLGTAKEASKSVPEIQTNPGEKVPEINPLDQANPFKYTNPLR